MRVALVLTKGVSMKVYELTVLFHPDLEVSLEPAINKVKEVITTNSGKILNENNEGKKRLAYAIDKQNYAVYYDFDVELPTESVGKVSNTLNITDEVIRYLLVAKEEQEEKEAKA